MKNHASFLKFLLVFLLLFACLGISSCGNAVFEERYRDECTAIVDALVADDKETAYAFFDPNAVPEENFSAFWEKVVPFFKDGGAYTLHELGESLRATADFQLHSEIYAVRFDGSGEYLQLGLAGDVLGGKLLNINFGEMKDRVLFGTVNDAPAVLQVIFAVYTFATLAFVVWMLIDCIRRPLPKKAVWILLILLGGFSVGFTRSVGLSVRAVMAWNPIFAMSSIAMDHFLSTVSVSLYLPLVAIYYFFNRKRLTPPPAEAVEFSEETEEEHSAEEEKTEG